MTKINFTFVLIMLTMNTYAVNRTDIYNYFFSIKSEARCDANKNCSMLKKNLETDSHNCISKPKKLASLSNYRYRNAYGALSYLGFVPGRYGYDIFRDVNGGITLESRIFIKNSKSFSQRELRQLTTTLEDAARIWTMGNYLTNFPITFRFKLTSVRNNAHVSPRLLRKPTRGPYFSKWTLEWDRYALAHEMGHVMGLNDEYRNTPFMSESAFDSCSYGSIMCHPVTGNPEDFHYYIILNRLVCKK